MNPSRRAEKAQQNWWSIRVKIEGAFDRGLRARSEGNSLLKVDRSRLRELPSKRHPNTASKSRPKRHERTSAEMAVEATAQISTLVRVSALDMAALHARRHYSQPSATDLPSATSS